MEDRLINVYADESVIFLEYCDEEGNYCESLIRFDKEEKTAELVEDKIRSFISWDVLHELPNELYLFMDIFDEQ